MKQVDKEYVLSHTEEIIEAIQNGSIFIYPTDTIYGLGCNANLDSSVKKIRVIKGRDTKPFSIIAPSKNWIIENNEVNEKDLLKYLPGPYTLFVKSKGKTVSSEVNPNNGTLGVRIPKHWFTEIIAKAQVPFVTTSVNLSGEKHMETLSDVPKEIFEKVDYIVYEGEKAGTSSEKINLVK